MELYAVIERTVAHECNIDWTYPRKWSNTYEEAHASFKAEKENLLQSMPDYSKSIIRDEDDIFCVQYGTIYRYVKIVSLY